MKITSVKGTNDYLPNEVEIRDYLQNEILKVYVENGFEHITTPVIEDIENLDKSDGGENLNLIFKIMKRGDKLDKALASGVTSQNENVLADMGLRYDLTLPLSRYFANNKDKLTLPMKCIQMDRVYRAERPQKGRLREFVQCDIDIIGSDSRDSEVELILITTKALKAIGMKNFKVKVNDRRLLRAFLMDCGFEESQLDSVCITFDKMDKVGYHSVECWGGATFDASLRFLKEDPWDRLRKLRDGFKNTKLQMLFRGQNILGYRPYADDVVDYFVQKSISNGIDIIRIFDCLNDLRNLQEAVNATNKFKAQEGRGEAQVALAYTLGDAYTLEYWTSMAKKIEEMGADSICIKDMAGLLVPYKAAELIKAMKEVTKLPIQLHTHYTSGVASMTYLKAVEAGVDVIDTAMSPFAMGTSQPATEVMVETFKGTPYDTGLDQNLLAEIADYFRPYRDECLANGLLNPKVMGVDIKTLLYQVPGGMLSNMVSQLKEQNAEDRYYDVLKEIPKVRKDLGEPPLVTPSSQIVGTQAVFNVLLGERYKMATKETKAVLRGEYGQTVKPMSQEVIDKVIPGEERITCRYADLLDNEMDKLEGEMKEWKQQDEDVLSYALFPQVATDFFKYRQAQQEKVDMTQADTKNGAYPV